FSCFVGPAPTAISTLSLHDALPIYAPGKAGVVGDRALGRGARRGSRRVVAPRDARLVGLVLRGLRRGPVLRLDGLRVIVVRMLLDRKSTRLNSSHLVISYAVFCLKK